MIRSVSLAFMMFVGLAVAMAQDADPVIKQGEPMTVTYALEYCDARSAVPILERFFGDGEGVRVAADERTNCLIILGTKKNHEAVKKLLKSLDVQHAKKSITWMIHHDARDQKEMAETVSRLMAGEVEVHVGRGGVILMRGDRKKVEEAAEIVELLEKKTRQAREEIDAELTITAELNWLGEGAGDATELDPKLKAALEKRGYRDLASLGTLQLTTVLDHRAIARGAALEGFFEMAIQVTPLASGKRLLVELELDAKRGEQPLQLSSTVKMPLDQWVIFGVASSHRDERGGALRSLFLLRLRQENATIPLD